jgi:hypothetical protein
LKKLSCIFPGDSISFKECVCTERIFSSLRLAAMAPDIFSDFNSSVYAIIGSLLELDLELLKLLSRSIINLSGPSTDLSKLIIFLFANLGCILSIEYDL